MVVPLSNASPKPEAVVVKFEDTVVANMAVRSSGWPEYIACFAILELEQIISLHVDSMIKNAVIFSDEGVFPGYFLFAIPCSRRNNAGVSTGREHEKEIDYWDEYNLNYDEHLIYCTQLTGFIHEEVESEDVK